MILQCHARKALLCSLAALSAFLISCSPSGELYRRVDEDVSRGEYLSAIEAVRENKGAYGDKSTVLYNLDMGMLFHYARMPDSSNAYFFAAEKEIEDLYTKSISLAALSFILNDNLLPYEGEDFEKVLLNVFLALNYAQKGMTEDALVEARKVDLKLRQYEREYEEKNTYKEDAFIRYIAGALYETDGEMNDAFISYRKSYEAYQTYEKEYHTPPPQFLLDDLVRTASLVGFDDEAEAYVALGGRQFDGSQRDDGSVIVVTYTGKGPVKVEQRPTVTIPDTSGTLHTFQIALPKFLPRHSIPRRYVVSVVSSSDSVHARTELAEDITAIAGKSLEDRLALVYLKSGGRALLKFLAAEKAKSEMKRDGENKAKNFFGSLAVDLIVGITEQADTRTWRTLPAEIQLARFNLTPGSYSLSVRSSDGGFSSEDISVRVGGGKTTFVIVDDVR